MIILFLLLPLLQITNCTVHTVTPDDHYYPNTTCHHCHNLQHYLLNITKYFTSNTQLLFLPGLHHLRTDLIIQNVHNISLTGSTANGTTLDTVIQCNVSVGIVMTNITDLTMNSMILKGCMKALVETYQAAITIKNCFNVVLSYMEIYFTFRFKLYLLGINILGKSRLSHISCNRAHFIYNDTQTRNMNNTLLIDHLQQEEIIKSTSIELTMHQRSYKIKIWLTSITIRMQFRVFLYGQLHNSISSITNCQFLSTLTPLINMQDVNINSSIVFTNCKFMNNPLINLFWKRHSLIKTHNINIKIINCIFNETSSVLKLFGNKHYEKITVIIKNTQFLNLRFLYPENFLLFFDEFLPLGILKFPLEISHANLMLEGMVTFHNITNHDSIITLTDDSTITIHGRIEFSNNSGLQLISFVYNDIQYINIKEPSIVSIHHNQVCNYFAMFSSEKPLHLLCIFQYFSNRTFEQGNFSIIFYNNQYNDECIHNYGIPLPIITNCYWLPKSTFSHVIPTDVNNRFVKYNNNSIKVNNDHSVLCACNDQMEYTVASMI